MTLRTPFILGFPEAFPNKNADGQPPLTYL